MRTFRTEITEYTIRNDGVVLGRDINLETPRTMENVAASFDRLAETMQGTKPPGLWDATSVPAFPRTVWLAFVDRVGKVLTALAILVDDSSEKAMGGFPGAINSMLIPVRLFRDKDAAIEWLQQYVDNGDSP